MKQQLKPLFDQVVIKELEPDRVRRSGLVVPPGSHEPPPQHGIVLAVGPGLDWWGHVGVRMPVKPGDHVVFPASAGAWVEVEEERLLVCRVGELLGVLETLKDCPHCSGIVLAAGDTCPVCGRMGETPAEAFGSD
jgi:chaperonin GroES